MPTKPFMSPLFVLNTSGIMIYLVYVDDNIIIGDNDGVVQKFILNLTQRFSLKNLELLSYFLSVEVTHHCHGIFLFQRQYIGYLLARTRMLNAKPITTPFATSPTLKLHTSIIFSNPIEYHTIIGNLHYLSLTQLGIAFKVNKLSQFIHRLTSDHWTAIKCLFNIFVAHLIMVWFFITTIPSFFMPFLMSIGLVIEMNSLLQVLTSSTLVATLSHKV